MSNESKFPIDANGEALQRMYDKGDDLTKPRIVEFCFVFSVRGQAVAFIDIVDGKDYEVCISFYQDRDVWQAIVRRFMTPSYANIVKEESTLTSQAELVGGEPDGWGCMQVH